MIELAFLESKDLILELADWTGLVVSEGLGSLLQATDHWWRTADKDLDIVGRLGEPLLEVGLAKALLR
jgi:hypothetical protein